MLPPAATGGAWVLALWAQVAGRGHVRVAFRLADAADGDTAATMLAAGGVRVAVRPVAGGGRGDPAGTAPPTPRSLLAAAASAFAADPGFEGLVEAATGLLPRVLDALGEAG